FFYKHADRQPLLIFVELKGQNLVHALDQLEATIGAVKPRIETVVKQSTRYLALVVSDGARPTTRARSRRSARRGPGSTCAYRRRDVARRPSTCGRCSGRSQRWLRSSRSDLPRRERGAIFQGQAMFLLKSQQAALMPGAPWLLA